MPTKTFIVEGLTCLDCAARVRASVCQVEGVDNCQVDHAAGTLTISSTMPDLAVEQVAGAVRSAGYTLVTEPASAFRREGSSILGFVRFILSKRETRMTAVAGLLTLLGLALGVADAPPWSRTALFAVAIVVGGMPVARHAFQELRLSRSLGINTLMVIAVVGAAFIGEWAEAAIVVVLFSFGDALEGYATEQARGALDSLLDLAPPVALKLLPAGDT